MREDRHLPGAMNNPQVPPSRWMLDLLKKKNSQMRDLLVQCEGVVSGLQEATDKSEDLKKDLSREKTLSRSLHSTVTNLRQELAEASARVFCLNAELGDLKKEKQTYVPSDAPVKASDGSAPRPRWFRVEDSYRSDYPTRLVEDEGVGVVALCVSRKLALDLAILLNTAAENSGLRDQNAVLEQELTRLRARVRALEQVRDAAKPCIGGLRGIAGNEYRDYLNAWDVALKAAREQA